MKYVISLKAKKMKLTDVDYRSELMQKAMSEGIDTIDDYEVWLMGYTTGVKDCKEKIANVPVGVEDEL